MKIKSFYANSMDVALQSAGKEMGDDALILNTRESPSEYRHYGKYEVVCAVADLPDTFPVLTDVQAQPILRGTPRQDSIPVARVVFLVGPSGVGKSSACSKIAIHSKFDLGLSPAVVSWDNGRVGGSDFVRSYCEIAGIPFSEVESQDGFHTAIQRFRDADLVLVDTAALEGNEIISGEIQAVIESLPQPEIHLVLSSTYSSAYLNACLNTYARFQPEFLLPTHLDQARMDLAAPGMQAINTLSIRWCGTGRAVPEGLEDAGQVVERAAAMAQPQVAKKSFAIAAVETTVPAKRSEAIAASATARGAIEAILARFRRVDSEGGTQISRTQKSSAA